VSADELDGRSEEWRRGRQSTRSTSAAWPGCPLDPSGAASEADRASALESVASLAFWQRWAGSPTYYGSVLYGAVSARPNAAVLAAIESPEPQPPTNSAVANGLPCKVMAMLHHLIPLRTPAARVLDRDPGTGSRTLFASVHWMRRSITPAWGARGSLDNAPASSTRNVQPRRIVGTHSGCGRGRTDPEGRANPRATCSRATQQCLAAGVVANRPRGHSA